MIIGIGVGVGFQQGVGSFVQIPEEPNIIVSDSFNRADFDSLGVSDTGQTWQILSGDWAIRNQRAKVLTTSVGNDRAVINSGLSNCKVSAKVYRNGNNAMRITLRYVDSQNEIMVDYGFQGSDARIIKRVNNSQTILLSSASTVNEGSLFEITLNGPTVSMSIDGVFKGSATITEFLTSTTHGMFCVAGSNALVEFDYFRVEEL